MTITEFLEARIAEDEYEANVCLAQYRRGEGGSSRRWKRQLAECAAKRAIIEQHKRYAREAAENVGIAFVGARSGQEVTADSLKSLAAIYADHQDYQQEWA